MLQDPLPERFVPLPIIRKAFNSGQFWERAQRGEFTLEFERDTHYTRQVARERNFTYCTRSQVLRYFDSNGNRIAVVHQIRNPDGTIRASGKPDPKYLQLETEVLRVDDSLT